jgi:hypothetical protein
MIGRERTGSVPNLQKWRETREGFRGIVKRCYRSYVKVLSRQPDQYYHVNNSLFQSYQNHDAGQRDDSEDGLNGCLLVI